MEQVILVNELDEEVGTMDRVQAHLGNGALHRAFSIFLFDSCGRMMIQKRAAHKSCFPGVWANACCSHPRPGESIMDAAHRRLGEELSIDTDLRPLFTFIYSARDTRSATTEHELDHVFVGRIDELPQANPEEIDEWRWIQTKALTRDIEDAPEQYAPWFKLALPRVLQKQTN